MSDDKRIVEMWEHWSHLREIEDGPERLPDVTTEKHIDVVGYLLTRLEQAEIVLDGLLDGLDANCDERVGLSNEEWAERIAVARRFLESD